MKRSHETYTSNTNQTTPTGPEQQDVSTLPKDIIKLIYPGLSFSNWPTLGRVLPEYHRQQAEIRYLIEHKEAICKDETLTSILANSFSILNVLKDKDVTDSYKEKEACLDNIRGCLEIQFFISIIGPFKPKGLQEVA